MAFDKVEALVVTSRAGMPASVSLTTGSRGGGRPLCRVSFSSSFVASFKISDKDRFDLLLGSGEQKGLLRLKRNRSGVVAPTVNGKGGITFKLGFIERYGTEPEKKQFCNAEVLDADTIEVVLPKWADEIEG